ncbi:MAG: hypothetical protein RJB09_461 [Pseudomonadota bacterium]
MVNTNDIVLEAQGLGLQLRQGNTLLRVVDEVSFIIRQGEFYGLIGESGSGKTMIARAIMRLLPPSRLVISGSLTLTGHSIAHAAEPEMQALRGKSVSMIFQEPMTSLNPIMTVEQQIGEAMEVHSSLSVADRKDKIARLLMEVRFDDPARVASLYPHELSGGMRQRVMIAIALANDPLLLIADEPTTALDVTIQQEIMEILSRLRESHRLAVLFISHDLALVNRYADSIGVLYGGVLMEQGPTAQVIGAPAHPYTSALLSCMPRARVGAQRQVGIEGSVPRIDNWFTGCRFAPRCSKSDALCAAQPIALTPLSDTRSVRCLYPLT